MKKIISLDSPQEYEKSIAGKTAVDSENSRRNILKQTAAGSAALSAGLVLNKWQKPVIESALLPAHAQTSAPGNGNNASTTANPAGGTTVTPATTATFTTTIAPPTTAAPLTITAATPSLVPSNTPTLVTITGTGFVGGTPSIQFRNGSAPFNGGTASVIDASNETIVNSTTITVMTPVANTAVNAGTAIDITLSGGAMASSSGSPLLTFLTP